MPISYDPTLVMLSILVAITAALTGLTMTAGYSAGARRGTLGLLKGAVIIGGGIWSMHFIAMLAVKLPIPVNYDFIETMVSLYVAIIGTALGLFTVAKRKLGVLSVPIGGILMGGAIAGMHYMGMDAMRGCGLTYDMPGVYASIVVAMVSATIALWFALRKRGAGETLVGGLLLGLAIPSMHYIGMVATSFTDLALPADSVAPMLSQQNLALIIATATFVICGIFLFLFSALAMGEAQPGHYNGRG
jgi:NO-binding membrane sensor protein with MHYT domain